MGALVPTITGLTSAITAVDGLVNTVRDVSGGGQYQQQTDNTAEIIRAQQKLALQQLQAQQAAQERDLAERTALEREKLQAETDAAERDRLASLRRAVARQRAAFGAQGIEATDGSAEAVLLGLFDETDEDRTERERLDDIRNRVLEQDLAAQKRLNILQTSQLKQKQQLQKVVEGI